MVTLQGNQLLFDNEVAATWTDDFTTNCKVELTFTPQGSNEAKPVASGDKLSEAGILKLTVADEFGNKSTAEITLTRVDSQAPTVEVKIAEKNVIAGVTASVQDNQLLFNEAVAAIWTDDYTESCEIGLILTSAESSEIKAIASGDILSEAGTLKLTVTDEFDNSATAEIKLTAVAVYGLENLQNKQLQVDQEVNLLEGVTIAEGLTLKKVEAEQDGIRTEVVNPRAFVPEYPGSVDIILTLAKPGGNTITVTTGNLNVKPLEYTVIVLKTADVINSQYAWFNNIQSQSKKAFVYSHLLTSYITGERFKMDNMEYIVMGEVPEFAQEYPNICDIASPNDHADGSCRHVKQMSPFSTIKVCGGFWTDLLDYISLHPDKHFMISCAWDSLG